MGYILPINHEPSLYYQERLMKDKKPSLKVEAIKKITFNRPHDIQKQNIETSLRWINKQISYRNKISEHNEKVRHFDGYV